MRPKLKLLNLAPPTANHQLHLMVLQLSHNVVIGHPVPHWWTNYLRSYRYKEEYPIVLGNAVVHPVAELFHARLQSLDEARG